MALAQIIKSQLGYWHSKQNNKKEGYAAWADLDNGPVISFSHSRFVVVVIKKKKKNPVCYDHLESERINRKDNDQIPILKQFA